MVTIHLILSKRTRGLVGAAELALMKPASWLINTSRGSIVDEGALIRALKSRTIAGVALDVFDAEPLPVDHPFRTLDNVLRRRISDMSRKISTGRFTATRPEALTHGSMRRRDSNQA